MPRIRHSAPIAALASLMLVAGCAYDDSAVDRAASPQGAEWGYEGAGAPERWGSLSPEYAACEGGTDRSPIDLAGAQRMDLPDPEFRYGINPVSMVNLGSTLQVNFGAGGAMMVDGRRYELAQFHFHTPSEHRLQGREFPAELHLVHRGPAGELAVIGVFIEEGRENPTLGSLWNQLPLPRGEERRLAGVELSVEELLPGERQYYLYPGSLTAPPCTEGVTWMVMREPLEMSAEQVAQLRSLISTSNRPVQPLGSRELRLDSQ